MNLSKSHIEILDHTLNRAAGRRFCGGGETMDELVDIGLMKYIGQVAWCPDKYYTITPEGVKALSEHKEQPQPNSK